MANLAQVRARLIWLRAEFELLLITENTPSARDVRDQCVQKVYKGFDDVLDALSAAEAKEACVEEAGLTLSDLVKDATGKVYLSQVSEITARLVRRYYELGYVDASMKALPGSNINWPDIVTSDMVDAAHACGPFYTKEKLAKGILAAFLFAKGYPTEEVEEEQLPRPKPSIPGTDERWFASWIDTDWTYFLNTRNRPLPTWEWSRQRQAWIPYDPTS